MDIIEYREFCLSLPYVEESMPFGDNTLVYKVGGKLFTACDIEHFDRIVVKCHPDRALVMRARYSEITPAWHFNKRHWSDISVTGGLTNDFLRDEIRYSYMEVLTRSVTPASLRREILAVAEAEGLHLPDIE